MVVDVRKSFYSPEPRIISSNLNNNITNRVSRAKDDIVVDLRTNVNPNHLMTNTLKTVETRNVNK